MAYNVYFTVSGAGSDTGPFDISGTTSGGVTTLIEGNIPKSTLVGGYELTIQDNTITGGTVQSLGTCTTTATWTKPSMWLTVYGRDVANTPSSIVLFYSISTDGGNTWGSNVNVPGYTMSPLPGTCSLLYTITGLEQGYMVKFGTSTGCVMNGTDNTTSCPPSIPSGFEYVTTINTPSPDSVAITINSDIIY